MQTSVPRAATALAIALLAPWGGANTTDSGYTQGSNGILTAGNGSQLDLPGGGLKDAATRQVCDKILNQAKSML